MPHLRNHPTKDYPLTVSPSAQLSSHTKGKRQGGPELMVKGQVSTSTKAAADAYVSSHVPPSSSATMKKDSHNLHGLSTTGGSPSSHVTETRVKKRRQTTADLRKLIKKQKKAEKRLIASIEQAHLQPEHSVLQSSRATAGETHMVQNNVELRSTSPEGK